MKVKLMAMGIAVVLACTGCTNTKSAGGKIINATNGSIDYKVLNIMDFPYQSFVKNWDDGKEPVRCALIKTAADFDKYFGAAATMGNTKPFAPSAEDFGEYQYVLVSQVTTPREQGLSFAVDSIAYTDKHLDVYYTFTKPEKDAGYTIKDGFLVQLPRIEIESVSVYENKQKVGEIK